MRKLIFPATIAVLSFLLLTSCTPQQQVASEEEALPTLTGPYLGQEPPGAEPKIFAPGFVSTGLNELNSVFYPDSREFYFAVQLGGGPNWAILVTKEVDGVWTEPAILPFTRRHSAVDLCISADGGRMLFCSNRSRAGGEEVEADFDIWYVQREGGSWGEPENLGPIVNSDQHEFYPCLTADGTLYFQSGREGSQAGSRDLYRSRLVDGRYTEPENLGPVVNSANDEGDVFVAPDESYIIFCAVRGGVRGLFISFRTEDDSWTEPRHMAEHMTADPTDYCPMLSPDGKYFFFTSRRSALDITDPELTYPELVKKASQPGFMSGDIYWADASIIDRFRTEQ